MCFCADDGSAVYYATYTAYNGRAILPQLNLQDPTRVIGRLREPLLGAEGAEREGYVPNVVYSCGSLIHGADLILPYAMSDKATGFASVDLAELLAALHG